MIFKALLYIVAYIVVGAIFWGLFIRFTRLGNSADGWVICITWPIVPIVYLCVIMAKICKWLAEIVSGKKIK